ncbi:MAG: FAD-dependent oxidoreductase [Archaeoglobaceae archaeon]|nr:FAD-dependent oxidoreductase [Archaeoglobaceae archaeon]MDW7989421.1 FAD-dependent oxidoreductase [Archaeoglobaceae archaeon]
MKVLIVGGGAAGMTAASRVKAMKPEWDVKVFEETNFVSHAPCGIPYVVEGISKANNLMYYPPEFFRRERGIDLHINAKVIDAGEGYLRVIENGKENKYEWDKLLIATGASPRLPKVKGIELDGIVTVRHPANAEKLKEKVNEANRIVIVGAGYLGVEMAEAVSAIGKKAIVLEFLDQPLPNLDKEIAEIVKAEMEKKVELRLNEGVKAFEGKNKVERVITDKGSYECDLAIVATGVRANIEIAKMLGCRIGETGAIWVDDKMQTNIENVFSAGDCVETKHLITGKKVWIPLAPTANKMGYVAGVNIADGYLEFPGVLGTQLTKFFDLEIGSTGLNEKSAKSEGFKVKATVIKARTRVHYYPGGKELTLKVVADSDGRVLGAQAVGGEVAMRINIFAAMIQAGFKTKDIFFSDLAYAPPLTPIWDPIIVSARTLKF